MTQQSKKIFGLLLLAVIILSSASFALAYTPIACQTDVVGRGTYIMTNVNNSSESQSLVADRKATFSWTLSEPGDYVYRVESAQTGEDEVYQVTHSVYLDDGALDVVTSIKQMSDEAKVDVIDYVGCTETIPVSTKVDGEQPSSDAVQFHIQAKDSNSPMPEGSENGEKTVSVTGDGAVDFGDFRFTEPGVYDYDITVADDGNGDYDYDNSIYTVRFTVAREDGVLTVTKSFYKNGQLMPNATIIEITNTYIGNNQGENTEADYYFDNSSEKTWQKGSNETLDVTIHRSEDDSSAFDHFDKFYVDNIFVPSSNYTAVSGSVKASFSLNYMETLTVGNHLLKAEFDDGAASLAFTVTQEQNSGGNSSGNQSENSGSNSGNSSGNSPGSGTNTNQQSSTSTAAQTTTTTTTNATYQQGKTGDSYKIFQYAVIGIVSLALFALIYLSNSKKIYKKEK